MTAAAQAYSTHGTSIGIQAETSTIALADPYLYIDPEWENGKYFVVQQESIESPGEWISINRNWRSNSGIGDTTPDPFSFNDLADVARNSLLTSNTISITGIDTATEITITGGEYSIGCNEIFTRKTGTVVNNDQVCVRHTASDNFNTKTDTTINIGGVSDTFTSITIASPTAGVASERPGDKKKNTLFGAFDWLFFVLLLYRPLYRAKCKLLLMT